MRGGKKSWIALVLGLIFFVGAAFALYKVLPGYTEKNASMDAGTDFQDRQNQEEELMDAPDFTVEDMDGNKVRLSDYNGTPIVLNFWASWCGPCREEMPDFQAAFQEYGAQEVQFLMVNATGNNGETVDAAKGFLMENAYIFPAYFDTKQEAVKAYGVRGFPSTVFISREGKIMGAVEGMISESTLQHGISLIMKPTIEVPEKELDPQGDGADDPALKPEEMDTLESSADSQKAEAAQSGDAAETSGGPETAAIEDDNPAPSEQN